MPFVIDTIQTGQISATQSLKVNGESISSGRIYKNYSAFLSQSGTDNPDDVVLENTLGFEVTWIRVSEGVYELILPPSTDITKIFMILGLNSSTITSVGIADKDGVKKIEISLDSDDLLDNSAIEIRIYP